MTNGIYGFIIALILGKMEKKQMSLKQFRTNCQKTQQELSKEIKTKRSTYSMWECGKSQPPLNKIPLLANALNVSESEIIECFKAIKKEI